jgi:hypothetical protein
MTMIRRCGGRFGIRVYAEIGMIPYPEPTPGLVFEANSDNGYMKM